MSNDLLSTMTDYICSSCGAEVKEGNKFCVRCGSPIQRSSTEAVAVSESSVTAVSGNAAPVPAASDSAAFAQRAGAPVSTTQAAPPPPPAAARQQVTAPPLNDAESVPTNKSKYQPISTGGYIGIWLLMLIPAVNLLLLIVWACGGCRKINKRNYARAMLVIGAITLVLGIILTLVFKDALSGLIPFVSPYGSF